MIHGVVSVIIPTGGRSTYHAALKSLRETSQDYPAQFITVIDSIDKFTPGHNEPYGWLHKRTVVSPGKGAIAAWNHGLMWADGEYIVMAADDLVFQEGWLTEALNCLGWQHGRYGCVGFNDMHNGTEHQTHFLLHRNFIINHLGGSLLCPHYKHFYCDNELVARAKGAGLYAYAEKSLVRHDHWANGRRDFDKWDESVKEYFREDEALFLVRQAAGFPNDFQAVITE